MDSASGASHLHGTVFSEGEPVEVRTAALEAVAALALENVRADDLSSQMFLTLAAIKDPELTTVALRAGELAAMLFPQTQAVRDLLASSGEIDRVASIADDELASERAALSEPLACVVHGIDACRDALLRPAQVVVIGGGPIGLLFVACLAREGHRVLLADPNVSRIEAALSMGATQAVQVPRDESAAGVLEAALTQPVDLAIDCTGSPAAWSQAIDLAQPGGMVNLFGGCAPGTTVSLDTHRVHYSEITVKGVYHHRPDSFRRALALLCDPNFPASHLLSARRPIEQVADALEDMISKRALKVVIAG